ncbi:MAG: malectin domain-containing carbohydrate-binding protein, partial [Flavobacteriaceae bacterium]
MQSNLDFNGVGTVDNVTSLMYGPDGRLYVLEYTGEIKIFTVDRIDIDDYQVTALETLTGINEIQNHNDDGTTDDGTERESTGLTVAGTATNPVIYVTSSDFRIGAGTSGGNGDINLDTNSGIITRFTWNGTSWDMVDLVRGLPRSEDNHATNGLEFVTVGTTDYLIVSQGGHTNGGSPSANFVYTGEYALSAAVLSVNLSMLETLPILNDNGRSYIYDLPTLDDPSRANVNGISDPDDPGYDGVDVNDPFGGNDGLNQAVIVPGGPVQIFSPGYRNTYDLVITQNGAVYVTDNGANQGWGGFPENEGLATVTNNYVVGEPGSNTPSGGEEINNADHLSLVTNNIQTYTFGSFYGGHPNPIRANPTGAGMFIAPDPNNTNGAVWRTAIYDPDGSTPGSTTDPNLGLPANWPPVQTANAVEGDWRGPGIANPDGDVDDIVTTWPTNTNGIDEYTASNFNGDMQGDLIAGVNSGRLRRVQLNPDGSLNTLTDSFLSGIGGDALGVSCNSDTDVFPGTIWVGTLNGKIVVFEPQPPINCIDPSDPTYDPLADYDFDGYSNQDEEDNGTDPCNGGSQPDDFDKSAGGTLISDLNDNDDDSDGILDANDPFQLGDHENAGSDAFPLPVVNELFSSNTMLGGYLGLGMTGLMNNGDPNANWLDWLDRRGDPTDPNPDDILGGALGAMTMQMTSGTALGATNTQEKGFQYGVQVDQNSGTFTVAGGIANFSGPLQLYGNQNAPTGELGFFIGDGTQSNYLKFVVSQAGLRLQQELNDSPQAPIELALAPANRPSGSVEFFFVVDPQSGQVNLEYRFDGGIRTAWTSILAEGAILNAIQNSGSDLAVGLIGTSNATGVEVEGTWSYLNVLGGDGTGLPRINIGGPLITASDGGLDWVANASNGSFSTSVYSVNTGFNVNVATIPPYVNRDASIPGYIDETTYNAIFAQERYDVAHSPEMEYVIPVPNDDYLVNIYVGNSYSFTDEVGDRVFDIALEGNIVKDNLDLIAEFGHQVGGMLSFPVTVSDGALNIQFLHEIENPIANAIEILEAELTHMPIVIDPVADQSTAEGVQLDGSFAIPATGGDGNLSYSASGLPPGLQIEPTNGQIGGTIDFGATANSPYLVTVVVDDSDGVTSDAQTVTFNWTVTPAPNTFEIHLNVGGPALTHNNQDYEADAFFTGGNTYTNANALVSPLYQTERSSNSLTFDYNIPVPDGDYDVSLHFAEIYWGANGGGPGGEGIRVFDVTMEGVLIMDDYDITADVGAEVEVVKTFPVTINDGEVNLNFSSLAGVGGANQPKVAAIQIVAVNNQSPTAVAEATPLTGEAPLEVTFTGSNSSDDNQIVSYLWDFGDGNTSTSSDPVHTYSSEGNYDATLTVEDDEGLTDTATVTINVSAIGGGVTVIGELKKWHDLSLMFTGPDTSEDAAVNPFLDYRLNVTFTSPTGTNYLIPGFYAADGNAAETGASSGDKWMVRFSPDEEGDWTYTASFRTGTEIAVSLDANEGSATSFDGANGTITIAASDKVFPDNRSKGRLSYVGNRYLQFQETGQNFLKAGADSPENMLAYGDFDNTLASKDWAPHVQDWQPGDPVWQSNKGQGLVGAINYLSGQGMNAFSFITMNVNGDGRDVWPWAATDHNDLNGSTQTEIDNRQRYDVSKLEQWEILFAHGDAKGMFLHFKTQETENDLLLDGGQLGVERKLYYRELIARFGHHLALNWNLGEEYNLYAQLNDPQNLVLKEYIDYISNLDAYGHPITVHSYPSQQGNIYNTLLGPGFNFTGPSIQSHIDNIHDDIVKWVQDSENAGKPWVVSNDEQGGPMEGVTADSDYSGNQGSVPDNREEVRHKALWGTLMAGGDGVEYYFGYDTGETDLTAQDFRSRAHKWEDAKLALDFFQQQIPYTQMDSHDDLVSDSNSFCLAELGVSYLIYMPQFISATLDLTSASGVFEVLWFDPVNGGALTQGSIPFVNSGQAADFGNPPNGSGTDWVIFLRSVPGTPPTALAEADVLSGDAPLDVSFTGSNSTDDVLVTDYFWDFGDGNTSTDADPLHTFTLAGSYDVTLTVSDAMGLTDTDTITIDVDDPPVNNFSLYINTGGPALTHNTQDFEADSFFVGGRAWSNNNAQLPDLYKTERSSNSREFDYAIPVPNGDYNVTLYFAEIYWGATGGGPGGIGRRIFDVTMEGVLIMDDYDITADVGAETAVQKVFPVTVSDGVLDLGFSALNAVGGVDQPKVSAIQVLSSNQNTPITVDPIADQNNEPGDSPTINVIATGGDPVEQFDYGISGEPMGMSIDNLSGVISGTIDAAALTGGPANDGVHNVVVTVSKPGSTPVNVNFDWTVSTASQWVIKNENESYLGRGECGLVQAGDKFYLIGGLESQTVQVYDYTSDSWNSLPDAPEMFNHFQAVEYQGLIWVIGALKTHSFPQDTPTDFVWIFDPTANDWIQGPPIPAGRKRGAAGLAVYNDKLYLVGGSTNGHNGGFVTWFDEFDPATGAWVSLPDAPRARDHFQATVVGDKLYAIGGRLSGGTGGFFAPTIAEVDVYDFLTGQWTTLSSDKNLTTPRAGASVAHFENQLIVIGGEVSQQIVYGVEVTGALDITEGFDLSTQTWSRLDDTNYTRHGTQAIVSGSGLYTLSGSPSFGLGDQKNMEYFGEDNPAGTASVASTLIPPPSTDIQNGQVEDMIIGTTSGNTGLFIRSLDITGTNAGDFQIESGDLQSILMGLQDTRQVSISYNGAGGGVAQLVINHGVADQTLVNLTGSNVTNNFSLFVNAGGPALNHAGQDFEADAFFVGGRSWSNNSVQLPDLYKTERSSNSREYDYAVPVPNGDYMVSLHFAEIYWGATGGGPGGIGRRIFDVILEGNLILDNYDITADVGAETVEVKTFAVTVADGVLDMNLSALAAVGGIDQPKLSAFEIVAVGGGGAKSSVSGTKGSEDAAAAPNTDFAAPTDFDLVLSPNPADYEAQLIFSNAVSRPEELRI